MKTKLNNIASVWKFLSPQLHKPSFNTLLVCKRPFPTTFKLIALTRPLSSTAPQLAFNKKVSAKNLKINKDEATDENFFENDKEEEQYEQLVNKAQLLPNAGHQVFLIQPYVKWGPKKNKSTTPDLMLEEAVALIDSLPRWKCVDTVKMPVETLDKKQLFGAGQFEKLQQEVCRNPMISAVFVSTNRLRGIQKKYLYFLSYFFSIIH